LNIGYPGGVPTYYNKLQDMLIFKIKENCYDYWHPMGNFKLLNDLFNATPYYLYLKKIFNHLKSLKYMINYKSRKKHMYKRRKISRLWGSDSRFMV
jgi:hypothetical protein